MQFCFNKTDVPWHRWFAWHPVDIWQNGQRYVVWLEHVERRIDYSMQFGVHFYRLAGTK